MGHETLNMQRFWFSVMLFCAVLQGSEVKALQSEIVRSGQVSAQLLTDVSSVQPGLEFLLGVQLSMQPGWHTYWRNPGDSGAPIKLSWQVPEGIAIDQIGWPIPERIAYGPLTNLGYHDKVVIPFKVVVGQSFDGSQLTLRLNGKWLVCADICIPESAAVALTLPGSPVVSPDRAVKRLLESVVNELPRAIEGISSARLVDHQLTINVHFPGLHQADVERLDFLPYAENLLDLNTPVNVTYTDLGARLEMKIQNGATSSDLSGLVLYSEIVAGERLQSAFEINPSFQTPGVDQLGLLAALLLAFAGGLILNLMPCVFPVLSIKLLSLIDGVEKQAFQIRTHGWLYTVGVLVSFLVMAVVLLILRAGGDQIGWGFQLQSPVVVALLFYLFCLIGLNLSGFYEFGTRLQNLGSVWPDAKGGTGAFGAGVLASVVAAPCTAPFMGVALGYAIVQPWWLALAVFAALGLGMAAPILVLCHVPSMLEKLPKPGQWMVRFKEALAFPMYAAALWLLWVLVQQTGTVGLGLAGTGLLLIVFAIWLWPNNFSSAKSMQGSWQSVIRLVCVSCILLSLYAVWTLQSNSVVAASGQAGSDSEANKPGPSAIPFSPSALSTAVNKGMVFVNFTAAWCITCKVNDGLAIDTEITRDLFEAYSVTYMKADWTNEDPAITRALADYERLGVPLYLLFPQGAQRAEVLPQILTQNKLLEAVPRLAGIQADN